MTARRFTAVAFALALVVAGVLSQYASPHPDGLMHVAEATGFLSSESTGRTSGSPLAGYAVAGLRDARLSGGLAGVVGCLACFALVGAVTRRRA